MDGNIKFYTFGSSLELNGRMFSAGELSADLLDLSPYKYQPLHKRITRIQQFEDAYDETKDISHWRKLNEELNRLSDDLRRYQVFELLLAEDDHLFSAAREALYKPVRRQSVSLSEEELRKATEIGRRFLTLNIADNPSEQAVPIATPVQYPLIEENDEDFYRWLFANGVSDYAWDYYRETLRRYRIYLHDVRAFVWTIRNFIKFSLSKLKNNGPEYYAEALYGYYNDERTTKKLIVNPIYNNGDCYTTHDSYMLSYVPRLLPDGRAAICQKHITDSLQALLKADYMLALCSGYNIRRCIICGRYFLLKSGVHALYCENACPHAPRFSCRQFGTMEVQKELAADNPKIRAKQKVHGRITKDMQRGIISREDSYKAKDYIRDRLYEALRTPDLSVEAFEESIEPARVYKFCGITRKAKPRGRPPKPKDGDGL